MYVIFSVLCVLSTLSGAGCIVLAIRNSRLQMHMAEQALYEARMADIERMEKENKQRVEAARRAASGEGPQETAESEEETPADGETPDAEQSEEETVQEPILVKPYILGGVCMLLVAFLFAGLYLATRPVRYVRMWDGAMSGSQTQASMQASAAQPPAAPVTGADDTPFLGSGDRVTTETVEPGAVTVAEYSMGSTLAIGPVDVSIHNAVATKQLSSGSNTTGSLKTDGAFVIVDATITNNDRHTCRISGSMFSLTDDKGRTYRPSTESKIMMFLGNDIFLDRLGAGESRTGQLVFQLPKGRSAAALTIEPAFLGNGESQTIRLAA